MSQIESISITANGYTQKHESLEEEARHRGLKRNTPFRTPRRGNGGNGGRDGYDRRAKGCYEQYDRSDINVWSDRSDNNIFDRSWYLNGQAAPEPSQDGQQWDK